jgi:hypothetical protein
MNNSPHQANLFQVLRVQRQYSDAPRLVSEEIRAPLAVTSICLIAYAVFSHPVSQLLLVTAATFFATRFVKTILDQYISTYLLQELALRFTYSIPYIQCLSWSIALIFTFCVPRFALIIGMGIGVITGLAIDADVRGQQYNAT